MSDYKRGQEDLIQQIKIKVTRILDTSEGYDMLFDIINLLKTLKPLEDKGRNTEEEN